MGRQQRRRQREKERAERAGKVSMPTGMAVPESISLNPLLDKGSDAVNVMLNEATWSSGEFADLIDREDVDESSSLIQSATSAEPINWYDMATGETYLYK